MLIIKTYQVAQPKLIKSVQLT